MIYQLQIQMTEIPYFLLDVFTEKRFGGNQLAIFPPGHNLDENLFQKIANELRLSETVFLGPKNDDGAYPMRIFTPSVELPTAGHPTIGTAHFLAEKFEKTTSSPVKILLDQKVGHIEVEVEVLNGSVEHATMYQPLPQFGSIYHERSLFAALLSLRENELMDYPIQRISCGVPYTIIPVNSIESIKQIRFRLDVWDQVKALVEHSYIYAFSLGGETSDGLVHGRMFAPEAGILEDAATGSANGPLGCYLHHHDLLKGSIISEQGFEMDRPSIIHIQIEGDAQSNIQAVKVGGKSIMIGEGRIYIDQVK